MLFSLSHPTTPHTIKFWCHKYTALCLCTWVLWRLTTIVISKIFFIFAFLLRISFCPFGTSIAPFEIACSRVWFSPLSYSLSASSTSLNEVSAFSTSNFPQHCLSVTCDLLNPIMAASGKLYVVSLHMWRALTQSKTFRAPPPGLLCSPLSSRSRCFSGCPLVSASSGGGLLCLAGT